MRIITGLLKGRHITLPKGLDIRPTADRTKEGIFSIIGARKVIHGTTVLDLFAGSGNLGFEAISRGARRVLAVDKNKRCTNFIEETALEFDIANQLVTRTSSIEQYFSTPTVPYDIVFADPPYPYPEIPALITTVLTNGWLANNGWLILEHDKRHDFSEHEQCFIERSYGRTIVSIFTNPTTES